MATLYYTHFVTPAAQSAQTQEWSGVVELGRALTDRSGNRELAMLLAENFEIDYRDIRILHWARLH